MIFFEQLEKNAVKSKEEFLNNSPFEHIVIDNFCDAIKLNKALSDIPDPKEAGHNKSNDYMFAKNKFEKAHFELISPELTVLTISITARSVVAIVIASTGLSLESTRGENGVLSSNIKNLSSISLSIGCALKPLPIETT